MSGHATRPHGHGSHDPGLRLFLIALAVVVAVFLVAFMVMTEDAGGGVAAVSALPAALVVLL